MRRILGLALLLLFGPLPIISLLASVEEPQCQMACCKRKGVACALHSKVAPAGAFRAVSDCMSRAARGASAPSSNAAAFPAPGFSLGQPHAPTALIFVGRSSPATSAVRTLIYQRPPPSA